MKLQQTSLDQTGVAILTMQDKSEKIIPLFSVDPVTEANSLVENYFKESCEAIKAVYFTNNLMETKIEDMISSYKESHGYAILPEDYMEELISGFPYIIGEEVTYKKAFYA